MTLFYLIRHGEPDWELNEQYKLKGHGRDLFPFTSNRFHDLSWRHFALYCVGLMPEKALNCLEK